MFVVGKVPLPLMTAEIERDREGGGRRKGGRERLITADSNTFMVCIINIILHSFIVFMKEVRVM